MTARPSDENRRLVPRWRQTGPAGHRWERRSDPSGKPPTPAAVNRLSERLEAWHNEPSIETAAEVVQAALVAGDTDGALGAAEFLLRLDVPATATVRNIARHIRHPDLPASLSVPLLGPPEGGDGTTLSAGRIHQLRRELRDAPRNPLGWTDLAHLYASVGEVDKAVKAMAVATQHAPGNRFVLRAATRLFVHTKDSKRAHDLLRRDSRSPHDPWLLSAEIAVATISGRQPRFMRQARQLLDAHRNASGFVTELAGSVATLELEAGNHRQARKLFRLSLADPNDNAVAQAFWAQHASPSVATLDELLFRKPGTYEARTMQAFFQGNWRETQIQAEYWAADEPFSARPAQLGSYVAAAVNADYELARRFSKAGLLANPKDPVLRNNLVFAEAMLGNIPEAERQAALLPTTPEDRGMSCMLLATRGLVDFRAGRIEQGRQRYLAAVEIAQASGLEWTHAMLLVHLAEQELACGDPALGIELLGPERLSPLRKTLQRHRDLQDIFTRVIEEGSMSAASDRGDGTSTANRNAAVSTDPILLP